MALADATRQALMGVSVATLSTALYKRGLRGQVIQGAMPLDPHKPNMVGEAYTLRNIPAREDLNPITVFENPAHPQRAAIEACPPGHVLVVDSNEDPRAASGGDILIARLMVRGCAGIVTDGGFRDSAEIRALAIPAYCQRPSAPTNLTRYQAIEANVPIGCGSAPVFPGDVIVGDHEAVIVVPQEIADEIAAEAVEMTAFEDFVAQEVRGGASIVGLYPPTHAQTKERFAAWRAQNGR